MTFTRFNSRLTGIVDETSSRRHETNTSQERYGDKKMGFQSIEPQAIPKAKVFQFGSPVSLQPEGVALEQLFMQNRFWNDLVAVDKEFRGRYHDIINGYDDKIISLNNQINEITNRITELREHIKAQRKRQRKGKVSVDGSKEEIAALISKRKPLYDELKTYKAEVKIAIKPLLHKLDSEHKAKIKSLRQEYAAKGLYWGNYNAVLDSYLTARSRAMKEGAELRFHRFERSGRWTCQIQGGMRIADAFSLADNRFQIDPVAPEAWTHPSRNERRRLCRTKARIRIESTDDRQPVWLELPIVMHRPIPSDCLIKSVSISAKKVGNRSRWFLNVTVVTNGTAAATDQTGKVVAIDVGWRRKREGLRVGYWVDSDGHKGEILLDESFLQTDDRLAKLQQNRDNNFNLAKEKLLQWLSSKTGDNGEVPEWLLESTKYLNQWRACAKLAALVLHWRDNRFDGDGDICDWLEKWRKQDKHLWTWQANLREKMMGRRLDQFRVLASNLVKKYDVIILEDFDLRKVKTKKNPEEGVDVDSAIRNVSKIASVSALRNEIFRACAEAGKIIEKSAPFNTTLECPFCGGKINNHPRPAITVTCGTCGATYDQDWAGAENLIKKFIGKGEESVVGQAPERFARQEAQSANL
jgi:transposase/ribosomal protein S15P/S13E